MNVIAGEDVLVTDYLINFIFSPVGLILIIIAGMVFVAVFFMKKIGGFNKEFKGIPLDSILNTQFNSIMQVTRISGKWGSLKRGDKTIAKIIKVGKLAYTTENPEYTDKIKLVKKMSSEGKIKKEDRIKYLEDNKITKYVEKDLYIFRLSFNPDIPFIRMFMDLLFKPKYAVVDCNKVKRFDIDKNNNIKTFFNIDPKASVFSFGDVFVYGYYPMRMTQDLAWNYGREKEKEELVNYPKKVVHLEASHSKRIDTLEEFERLNEKKFNQRFGNL